MENSPATVVVRTASPATIVTEPAQIVQAIVASGGPAGAKGISGPSISLHAWPIIGEVAAESLPGLSWYVEEHEEQELIGIGFYLKKGKIKLSFEKNEEAILGFSNVVVSEGRTHILPTPVKLISWDYLNPNILEIKEKAELLSATLVVRHKIN